MIKSIMKILVIVVITIGVTIVFLNWWFNDSEFYEDPVTLLSENSIIEFSGDKVLVTDTYDMKVNSNVKFNFTYYSLALKVAKGVEEYAPTIKKILLDNEEIIVEGHTIIQNGIEYPNSIDMTSHINEEGERIGHIWTNYLGIEKSGQRHLEIIYEYDIDKVVEQYEDCCVMRFDTGRNKIIYPKEVSDFKLEGYKISFEKESSNIYSINTEDFGKYINNEIVVFVENTVINGGKVMGGAYSDISMKNELESISEKEIFPYFIILLVVLILFFVISIILTRKPKFESEYVRNTKEVLDSILAETLIDGHVGAKELIMTCILNSIKKGAIEVVNNETMILKDYENLNFYEKKIVSMIFEKSKEQIKFEDIKNMFVNNNIETKKFYEKFLEIKNSILSEMFQRNIYNKTCEYILKFIKIVSILMFVNIIPIVACLTNHYMYVSTDMLSFINQVAFCIILISMFEESKGKILTLKINALTCFILIATTSSLFLAWRCMLEILNSPILLFTIVFLYVINWFIYKNSQKHVLTQKGKGEYLKVLGLKQYIKDYSIMEKRDIDNMVLWDDYLVYATAFGITNKITNKLDESLLSVNINLQKINKIIGI